MDDFEDTTSVTFTGEVLAVDGSMALLSGLDEESNEVEFWAERNYASEIIEASESSDEDVVVAVPSYMLRRVVAR